MMGCPEAFFSPFTSLTRSLCSLGNAPSQLLQQRLPRQGRAQAALLPTASITSCFLFFSLFSLSDFFRFCIKLPQRGRKDKKEAQNVEQERVGSPSECCSCFPPIRGASQCCSLFWKSELLGIQRIRDAYEHQRKASQEDTEEV